MSSRNQVLGMYGVFSEMSRVFQNGFVDLQAEVE